MDTDSDPFLKVMEGRVPKSTVLGSAASVVGEGQPMRPDRNYDTVKWISTLGGALGLDHFYLRNPYSGLLKGVTFGGFLIWWLWDAFQLWTEKDRVLLYGLSAPFDLKTGFGQGTIADGKSHYEQRSDSAWWMLAALFSFVGADSMLLGNWGQMLRKLTEFALLALIVIPLLSSGVDGILSFGGIIRLLMGVLIGYIVVGEWINVTVPTFSDPATMFAKGIRISAKQDKILNIPRAWIENISIFGDEIPKRIMKDIGYVSISGDEFRKAFEVKYRSPADMAAEAAEEDAADKAQKEADAANPIRWHWMLSYLVYLFAPIILLGQVIYQGIKAVIYTIFPELALASKAQEAAMKAAGAVASGKDPLGALSAAALEVGGSRIPGLEKAGGLVHGIEKAAKMSEDIQNKISHVTDSVDSLKSLAGADLISKAAEAVTQTHGQKHQMGGARHEQPTGQGMILGASVFALAGSAAIKLAVDYFLPSE